MFSFSWISIFLGIYSSCAKIPKEDSSKNLDLRLFQESSYPLKSYHVIQHDVKNFFLDKTLQTNFALYEYIEKWDNKAISQIFDVPLHAILGGYIASNGKSTKIDAFLNPVTFFLWYLIFSRFSLDVCLSIQEKSSLSLNEDVRIILERIKSGVQNKGRDEINENLQKFQNLWFRFVNIDLDENSSLVDLERIISSASEDPYFLEKFLILTLLDPNYLLKMD